jgi:hypothetical protein
MISIVLTILACLLMIANIFYLIRNILVYRYRMSLVGTYKYDCLPDYNNMVLSFKPLKDDYWINKNIERK